MAIFYALLKESDILLAGPYIESYSASFKRFLSDNRFEILDYNNYEIVGKSEHSIKSAKSIELDNNLIFAFSLTSKIVRLRELASGLINAGENCIVYCSRQSDTERYASKIISSAPFTKHQADYKDFLEHLGSAFDKDWIVYKALKAGVGVHHASIPKYIQKEIIALFNKGKINVLFSTTTITEGVNTSAKNLIVMNNRKGKKALRRFDAKNIAGRAGRFLHHYKGRVIALQNNFIDDLHQETDGIKHKHYDLNANKDEVDLFYTNDEFLKAQEREKKAKIIEEQRKRGLPEELFSQFKVVSRSDKIKLYDTIKKLSASDKQKLASLVTSIYSYDGIRIDWNGFQLFLDIIRPIVTDKNIQTLIDTKSNKGTSPYSVLLPPTANYLQKGFRDLVDYHIHQGEHIDAAMRLATKFVANTLKYQMVKYIGVFNVIYKYCIARESGKEIDDILGFDRLLLKLEYNALTNKGKIASDYGVPSLVLRYYEDKGDTKKIRERFDSYEKGIFERTENIIMRTTHEDDAID